MPESLVETAIEHACRATAKAVGEMVEGNFIDMNQAGNMAAAIIKGEESPRAWNQAIAAVQSDLKIFLGEEKPL